MAKFYMDGLPFELTATKSGKYALPDALTGTLAVSGSPTFTGTATFTDIELSGSVTAGGGIFATVATITGEVSAYTIVADDSTTPTITTASGKTNTGYLLLQGKTSGALKFLPADATAQTVTVATAAQTSGASTLTIPDQAGVSSSFVFTTLAQTLTNKILTAATATTSFTPTANDGAALGSASLSFADLFLASGAVINYANGNVVITHTSGILTMGTGDLRVTTAGTDTASVVTVGGTQTLTAKTLASPVITGVNSVDTKFCTTQFDATSGTTGTTLTDVTGLTGFTLTAGGVYTLEVFINGAATANNGHKIALDLTTATLTSAQYASHAMLASSMAYTQGTTATDPVPLHGTTSATLGLMIRARLVVNAGGTAAIQAAQNASHGDTTSVYVGSWARLTRIS